jgi:hypothetical protein
VLFLHLLVHPAFIDFVLLSLLLFLHLPVELLSDQSLAFLFSNDGLFLLFVMKQGVELLDRCPFIVFGKFAENLSLWVLAGNRALSISLLFEFTRLGGALA